MIKSEQQTLRLVSEYRITREFGGPEEGGWWWDRREFVRVTSRNLTEDQARAECKRRNKEEQDACRECAVHDRFSVLGGADTRWIMEESARQFERVEVPHYE